MDVEFELDQSSVGAQVLVAKAPSISNLFYQSLVPSGLGRSSRGGVPVIFPQFADHGLLRKHGFARDLQWTTTLQQQTALHHRIHNLLEVTSADLPEWAHSVRLELKTSLSAGKFNQSLEIINTGNTSFSWTGGLHPYFLINDLLKIRLIGLEGARYKDRYSHGESFWCENQTQWTEAPCEILFEKSPNLKLHTGLKTLWISTSGFSQWMIWNPGLVASRILPDMEDDDWRRFICIEPVCVDNPIKLNPGESFLGDLLVQWQI